MSKPSNSIKKVKLPNNTECEIVPDKIGSGTYVASLPSLSADATLVTTGTLATSNNVGLVKPDGTTTSVNSSGVISVIGGVGSSTDVQINGTSITSSNVANIITNTAYNASSNKIATMSDVPAITSTDVSLMEVD